MGDTQASEQGQQNLLSATVTTIEGLNDTGPIVTLPTSHNPLSDRVFLASDDHNNSRIHRFIEYKVFFKTEKFKNEPRANNILFRCFKATLAISIICICLVVVVVTIQWLIALHPSLGRGYKPSFKALFLFGNAVKFPLAFLGCLSAMFWRSSDIFRQQWYYCANLTMRLSSALTGAVVLLFGLHLQ